MNTGAESNTKPLKGKAGRSSCADPSPDKTPHTNHTPPSAGFFIALETWHHRLQGGLTKISSTTHLLSYKEAGYQDFQMTVENANAFLDELKANGPNAKLMAKVGKDFQPEHMKEALKAKEINDEELLKGASGGASIEFHAVNSAAVAGVAAAAAI